MNTSTTTQPLVWDRGRLPSDSTLREMYGPLNREDIDRMVRISTGVDVPHDWLPCDDSGAVGVGPSVLLCVGTKHIVDTVASEFASRAHLGRERRATLAVRRGYYGWMLLCVIVPGADLPGTLNVSAGTFASASDPRISTAFDATYPDMDSLSRSIVAGLCGALSAHAQRWLPPYVLDHSLAQSLSVTTDTMGKSVRALQKATKRLGGGACRLVLSPKPVEVWPGMIDLSFAIESINADDSADTIDTMEESTVDDAPAAGAEATALRSMPPTRQRASQQNPVELLGLYPGMATGEAIRVLSIDDSLVDVAHQWTAQPVGDVLAVTHDLDAPLDVLKATADSIRKHFGSQQRLLLCALRDNNVDGAYTRVRIAVDRPVSTPKAQTADDLLDLYPDVTAREMIALVHVIVALTDTPTEWVASDSGHLFDRQGSFAPAQSVAQRIADVVRPLVASRSSGAGAVAHHAVLTLDRDRDTRDLIYRFAIVPTPPGRV
ncbi:hypothetical protein psal_cds_495 [Pandoravirus salinus]|uniref:DUF5860 domain-containing protein n=1 Tax=Pandoravirus salinus TaxID=1349410 RepID=S4W1H1_9VIRU|nr:hypothetical protein psal_cds_495 [Pandoravirus salinus]AGO84282.2 hypothetical protein psal_cds_495 [Pandoravirus salinus]